MGLGWKSRRGILSCRASKPVAPSESARSIGRARKWRLIRALHPARSRPARPVDRAPGRRCLACPVSPSPAILQCSNGVPASRNFIVSPVAAVVQSGETAGWSKAARGKAPRDDGRSGFSGPIETRRDDRLPR